MNKITYCLNYDKAIEAIVWLVNKKPLDIYHIGKIIFYAEKKHINKYARPIIGDIYRTGDYGPFPSGVFDLIRKTAFLDGKYIPLVERSFEVNYSPWAIVSPKREPDMDYFSGTDIECLEEAFVENVGKSFGQIKNESHKEECYLESEIGEYIDYEKFVNTDNPYREEIIKEMLETAPYLQV